MRHESNGTQTRARERTCVECGRRIPPERLRLLPETWTCAGCSGERKKTDAELHVCEEDFR